MVRLVPTFRITNALTGDLICFVEGLLPSDTVRALREHVERAVCIPVNEQHLLFDGEELQDFAALPELLKTIDVREARRDENTDCVSPTDCVAVTEFLEVLLLRRCVSDETRAEQIEHAAVIKRVLTGTKLMHVADRYRGVPDVILAAASRDICELKFAAGPALANPRLILAALRLNTNARYYAADSLWRDRSFVIEAVGIESELLSMASAELRDDPEVVNAAVKHNGHALRFAGPQAKRDRDVVRNAVLRKGTSLCFADEELKDDEEIVLAAVQTSRMSIVHAARRVQKLQSIVNAMKPNVQLKTTTDYEEEKEGS